jgi:hypothetical protein
MDQVEAIALDDRHLELKKSLPIGVGKRLMIQILSSQKERALLLKQLEQAYLSMSDEEKQMEIEIAEEGLQGQPDIDTQFPGEEILFAGLR